MNLERGRMPLVRQKPSEADSGGASQSGVKAGETRNNLVPGAEPQAQKTYSGSGFYRPVEGVQDPYHRPGALRANYGAVGDRVTNQE